MKLVMLFLPFVAVPAVVTARSGHLLRARRAMIEPSDVASPQESAIALYAKSHGPIKMQVEDADMKRLSARLSNECDSQFAAMIRGEESQLHEFGDNRFRASEVGCDTFNGTLCYTTAHILEAQTLPGGRTGRTTTAVDGKSCLPKHCTSESDLRELAEFLRRQGRGAIASADVEIQLSVNCSGSGGSLVVSGDQKQAQ
eukprot:TRINITY_DN4544_c0_g1_i2.p1 TRINITY_DN4544_c0_g1~~TRINITY_DN4544_c0_g1_i2.p1  ORF type:complete len:218 (+),score=35.73 TRINITY_DN4544_c0_g1_i2:60-656(+)